MTPPAQPGEVASDTALSDRMPLCPDAFGFRLDWWLRPGTTDKTPCKR